MEAKLCEMSRARLLLANKNIQLDRKVNETARTRIMEQDDECHAASYTPKYLLPDLLDALHLHLLRSKTALLSMMRVVDTHEITTFVHVIGATEHGVHLLQHDPLCLRNEEVDEDGK